MSTLPVGVPEKPVRICVTVAGARRITAERKAAPAVVAAVVWADSEPGIMSTCGTIGEVNIGIPVNSLTELGDSRVARGARPYARNRPVVDGWPWQLEHAVGRHLDAVGRGGRHTPAQVKVKNSG